MRSHRIFVLGLACAEALNTTQSQCCPAGMCYNGFEYASHCKMAGFALPPTDGGDDSSCPSYESQCPAKCCEKQCCGAYGHSPAVLDSTCCHAEWKSMPGEGDSRCNLRCDSPITWKAHPTYAFDVSEFDGPHAKQAGSLPKKVLLWNRPQGNFNDNEYFLRDNGDSDSAPGWQGAKGSIFWHDLCLEATAASNGAAITVNTCRDVNDPLQTWNLVRTGHGKKIQLKDTNKCVNVVDLIAKNAQPLELWDCNNDEMQSFDVKENINYPGVTSLHV